MSALDEPTAIWMQMSCAAARYSLPRKIKKEFDDQFKKAIKKKPTSQTAGCLAKLLAPFKAAEINYTGRATHERHVIDYLKRAKRVRWKEEDLGHVCGFLALVPKQQVLRERMVKMGVKKFPNSAKIHFVAGQLEMEGGPAECDINKASRHMNRVLELSSQSAQSLDQEMIEMAKRSLSVLQDTKERLASPFGSPYSYSDDGTDGLFMPSLFGDDIGEGECDCDDCRSMRAEGTLPDDLDTATMLDELIQSLPQPLVKQLERAAAKAGVSLVEMLGRFIKGSMSNDSQNDSNEQGGEPRRTNKKRNKAQQTT